MAIKTHNKRISNQKRLKLALKAYFILVTLITLVTTSLLLKNYFQKQKANNIPEKISKGLLDKKSLEINNKCKDSIDKDHCYGEFFYIFTHKYNLADSVAILQNLQKINPEGTRGCHFMAHKISQAEVEKDPKQWLNIIKKVSPSMCTGGFLHGVLEAHVGDDPSFEINSTSVNYICENVLSYSSFAQRSCAHNFGHLMLIQTNGSIPKAVDQCGKLNKLSFKYECLSGTFMENITMENLVAHAIEPKRLPWTEKRAGEIESLCSQYSDLQAKACWKELSYIYFSVEGNNPIGLYKRCQKAPNKSMSDECYIYGAGNLVNTSRFSQDNLHVLCHQFSLQNPLFGRCMNQVIGSLITSTEENIDRTISLCEGTYDPFKKQCFKTISKILEINNTNRAKIQSTCLKMPQDVRNYACPS